jgi:hypothetical protein
MSRRMVVVLLLACFPIAVRAELPVLTPKAAPAPTTVTETTPIVSTVPSTVGVESRAWSVSCQPASAVADPCKPACKPAIVKKPGILTNLKNWLCGTSPVESCEAVCPTPAVRVVVAEPCPAPVVCPKPKLAKSLPTRPTVECPKIEAAPARPIAAVAPACEKLKAFLCWKPCNEQLLPIFRPAPYQAPALAYLGPCREPAPGMPCGTCKKTGKKTCETATCAPAVGPVVASKPHPVMGAWTPIYANGPAPANAVPASATEPAKPAANPLARPFTMP